VWKGARGHRPAGGEMDGKEERRGSMRPARGEVDESAERREPMRPGRGKMNETTENRKPMRPARGEMDETAERREPMWAARGEMPRQPGEGRRAHLQVECEEIVGREQPPAVTDAVCSRVTQHAHTEWARYQSLL